MGCVEAAVVEGGRSHVAHSDTACRPGYRRRGAQFERTIVQRNVAVLTLHSSSVHGLERAIVQYGSAFVLEAHPSHGVVLKRHPRDGNGSAVHDVPKVIGYLPASDFGGSRGIVAERHGPIFTLRIGIPST